MRLLFFFLLSFFSTSLGWAQHQHTERCHTMKFQPVPAQYRPGGKVFEQQLREKIRENKLKRVESSYKIPVVVHIIHNGEPVGTGANISYAQILSQIDVLNEDFNRQNPDASDTPAEFQPVAASADIEFALAQVDPNGLPITNEPGVHRFQGGRNSWSEFTFARDIQPQTQWDPTRYLNIWVADFGAGSLLGYAQFPTASGLTGLENEPDVANTDGVVVHFEHFGDIDRVDTQSLRDGEPYNHGRTLTHEMGHFLGVLHIWGDGGCGVDDFCNDTPEAADSYYDCPATAESCGTADMYQNFMDYTDDVCMNLFTTDQVARMHSVLQTSPRRRELTSSTTGDVLAGLYPDFTADRTRICPGMEVQFQDLSEAYGDTQIIGVEWEFEGGSIASSTEPDPIVRYDQPGQYRVSLTVREVITEETITREDYITVVDTQIAQNELQEDVENYNAADWENPSGFWEVVNYSAYENGSRSLSVNNFTEDLRAEQDVSLWTPLLNIQTPGVVALSFDLAYGYRGSEDRADSLEISYSTDCGGTFITAWKKGGSELATRNTSSYLRPRAEDWQPVTVYMDASAGDFLQIRLRNVGSYGNAVYVDNLNVEFLGDVEPPVANFESGYPLALTDEEIPFYDLSENLVLSRTWGFQNGNPASSEAETPRVRFTTQGQANVSLTVRNTAGESVERKVDYLRVRHGFQFTDHMTDATPTALEADGGYFAGHNDAGDLAKAEFFEEGMEFFAADFDFAVAEGPADAQVSFFAWAVSADGTPGDVLEEVQIPLGDIQKYIERGLFTRVVFSQDISASSFFLGFALNNSDGSRLGLKVAAFRDAARSTGWEQKTDGTWQNYGDSRNRFAANAIYPLTTRLVSGLEDEEKPFAELHVFPNPAQHRIRWAESSESGEVFLQNLLGQTLRQAAISEGEIELSGLPQGLYLLRFRSTAGEQVVKFMVE